MVKITKGTASKSEVENGHVFIILAGRQSTWALVRLIQSLVLQLLAVFSLPIISASHS